VIARSAELGAVEAFLDRSAGGPGALTISGEAGIGKTTLWHAGLEAARGRGYAVLSCAPAEIETKLAYSALGDLLEDVPRSVIEALPTPRLQALDHALLGRASEGATSDQRAVALAFLAMLGRLADTAPVVLGIDDLQWLDESSARVLHFGLRRRGDALVSVLATVRRDGSAPPVDPLPRDGDELALEPLDEQAIAELLVARVERPLSPTVLRRLQRTSGGNPLFALELARSLAAADMSADIAVPVPESLRALVSGRLSRLSAAAREALLVASALERPTADVVLAALGDSGPGLDAAIDADLLRADRGRLSCTHPLLASVVYAEAPAVHRRMLHRRLARLVRGTEEQARHLALATTLPHSGVADILDRAAFSAAGRGAPDAAAAFCEEALRLTSADETGAVIRRTIAAAEHHFAAGSTEQARALLADLASGLRPGGPRADVHRRLARVRVFEEGWQDAHDLLRTALAEAPADDVPLRAAIQCDLGHVLHQCGDLAAALPHARRAVSLALKAGDGPLLDDARLNLAALEFQMGTADPADLASTFAPSHRGDGPAPGVVHRALFYVIWKKYSDDFDAARDALEHLTRHLRERHEEGSLAAVLFQAGELEAWAGNLEPARHLAEELRDTIARTGQPLMQARLLYLTALVSAYAGDVDRARSATEEGLRLADLATDTRLTIRLFATGGFIELSCGDATGAHSSLAHARELAAAAGYGEPAMFRFAADGIEALLALGDVEEAERQTAELEAQGLRLDRPWARATGARSRGLLSLAQGAPEAAVAALEHACHESERLPQPFELARTLLALGGAFRLARRKRAARDTLEEALAAFDWIGTPLWAEKARMELGRIGGRVAAQGRLTPTEERVAALVAEGKSNKEVAAELFVTVRTVEGHLSRVYEKLGLRSRTELARRLAGPRV
jgi:DNA-binding CsgD family transcriptional regulator